MRIFSTPQFFYEHTKLLPVMEAVEVIHDDVNKSFRLNYRDGNWLEMTPVNKSKFINAEVINKPGNRFGHVIPVGPTSVEYDITHSSSIVKSIKGWGKEIGEVWFGAGLAIWNKKFKTIISNNKAIIDLIGESGVNGKINLDPNITIDETSVYWPYTTSDSWAACRNIAENDDASLEGIQIRVFVEEDEFFTIERSAMQFDTSGYPEVESALLILTKSSGSGIARSFVTSSIDLASPVKNDYGDIKTSYEAVTPVAPEIDGNTYSFNMTSQYASGDFVVGLAELHDTGNIAPSGDRNYPLAFSSGYLEIELPSSVPGSSTSTLTSHRPRRSF